MPAEAAELLVTSASQISKAIGQLVTKRLPARVASQRVCSYRVTTSFAKTNRGSPRSGSVPCPSAAPYNGNRWFPRGRPRCEDCRSAPRGIRGYLSYRSMASASAAGL